MEFHKLDVTKASIIKREVDIALQKLTLYNSNNILNTDNVTSNEINRNKLYQSIQFRIQELENFCELNADDERIILFEKEKLRLRKAIMQTTHSHGASSAKSISSNTSDKININSNNTTTNRTIQQVQTNHSEMTPIITKSAKSINSTMSINTNSSHISRKEIENVSKSNPTIYAWEEGATGVKHIRESIIIDGNHYIPTNINGFYHNNTVANNAVSYNSDRCIDFQIILTEEELTTLAARKKQSSVITSSILSENNKLASTSVHANTPYIDPRRAIKDMLRPTNPEKWMDTNGLRPYQKRSFNLKS